MYFSYKILVPKITKPNITRERLLNLLLYKKLAHKTFMKMTTGVNFINILSALFLPISFCQKATVIRVKLRDLLSYKKHAIKRLMKLITEVSNNSDQLILLFVIQLTGFVLLPARKKCLTRGIFFINEKSNKSFEEKYFFPFLDVVLYKPLCTIRRIVKVNNIDNWCHLVLPNL